MCVQLPGTQPQNSVWGSKLGVRVQHFWPCLNMNARMAAERCQLGLSLRFLIWSVNLTCKWGCQPPGQLGFLLSPGWEISITGYSWTNMLCGCQIQCADMRWVSYTKHYKQIYRLHFTIQVRHKSHKKMSIFTARHLAASPDSNTVVSVAP